MRTSHLTLRRRIDSEKLKITDEELFAGGAFSGYLSDMAEAATKRYKRHTAVQCFWDESPDAHAAYTDNRKICVNAANPITQSFPPGSFGLTAWWAWPAMKLAISFLRIFKCGIYMPPPKKGWTYVSRRTLRADNQRTELSVRTGSRCMMMTK